MEPIVTISFTISELNTLLAALVEQPFKVSSPLVNKITQEATKQTTPEAEEDNQ